MELENKRNIVNNTISRIRSCQGIRDELRLLVLDRICSGNRIINTDNGPESLRYRNVVL